MLDSGLPIGRCIWTRQGEWWGSAFLGFTLIVSVLQVDSWALGVLLYTLVYGTMPFDGFDHKNLIRQISSGEYREPTQTSGIKKEWGQCIELTGVQNGRFAPCLLEYFGVMLEWHRKKISHSPTDFICSQFPSGYSIYQKPFWNESFIADRFYCLGETSASSFN